MPTRTVRELISRGLSRRRFFRAGSAGVASVVVSGLGVRSAPASANEVVLSATQAVPTGLTAAELRAVDPHLLTARTILQAQPSTATLRILPVSRAKFLAGARFDLRVEALGLSDPNAATVRIDIVGKNGPETMLLGEPVRSSATPTSFEVTYPDLSYARPGHFTVAATLEGATSQTMRVEVEHEVVVANSAGKRAKNVIFFWATVWGKVRSPRHVSSRAGLPKASTSACSKWTDSTIAASSRRPGTTRSPQTRPIRCPRT
jgi:alkaline phosphatase